MPIVGNRYYNDPQLGAAFAGLAQLFAPPSGADLAGYATAAARRGEAERLAALFDYARNPEGFDQTLFDRMGQAVGQWNPNQGYYAIDKDAATRLRQTELEQAGALQREMAKPITVGQDQRVFLPQQTQQATGLGPELQGFRGPLSETQWQAQQNERLRQQGAITDEMLVDAILGKQSPVMVAGPDGKPVYMTPGAAARQGSQAYVNRGSLPAPINYLTPDGRVGTARMSEEGVLVDTQTGAPIPAGSQQFSASAQGTPKDFGAPTSALVNKYMEQRAEATRALGILDLLEQVIDQNPGAVGIVGALRGTAQDTVAAAQDLAAAFGMSVPQAQAFAADVREGLGRIAPEMLDPFDPSIREVDFLLGTLAYVIARTENPGAEVSRQAWERAYDRIRGGMLANTRSTKANIGAYRKVLQSYIDTADSYIDPNAARTDARFQRPTGPMFEGGAAPAANGPRVINTPAGQVTIQRVD